MVNFLENVPKSFRYSIFFAAQSQWAYFPESDSFGTSLRKVSESVQFFQENPDVRESLPSWQDEETLLGNETFDFR